MKLPYFFKFGIKSTIIFFIIVTIAFILEAYAFNLTTEKGGPVMWLLILLMSPFFWLLHFSGLPSSFDSSPFWFLLVIYFLYFFIVFNIIGIVVGFIADKKKFNIR